MSIGNNKVRAVWNFSAGPSTLPSSVLEKAQEELLSWNDSGISVLEASHRCPDFELLIRDTESRLRRLMRIPNDFRIFFMQGGGTAQFAAVALNLTRSPDSIVRYLISGTWSKKAAEEAAKFVTIDDASSLCEYLYICDNETIEGVELPPTRTATISLSETPVVCDMSSNFLSRPVDWSRFGCVFATAQKNFGPAGLTVVVVRSSLLEKQCSHRIPSTLDYRVFAQEPTGMPNTPPTFAIYLSNLVLQWLETTFIDIEGIAEHNARKAVTLYDALDSMSAFYTVLVTDHSHRSRMNVVFRTPTSELDGRLVQEAAQSNLIGLAGHRSVGGLRASLYNALPLEAVHALVQFLRSFAATNGMDQTANID